MASRKLIVEVVGDTRNLEKNLGQATKTTKGFEVGLKNLAKTAATVFGAAVVIDGLKDIINKAEESQVSMAKLEAATKSSGVSMKTFAGELDKAQAAGRKLGFSNIETQGALAKLVVATQSGTVAVRDLSTAQDLARFKHIDVAAAAQMLSQAMTGSARAVKQLGINVIPLTTNLTALKAAHKAAGTAASQQEIAAAKLADKQATGAKIIEIVTQRLHGQADAYSKTTAGAMARFKAALEDIEERIGAKLLPVMTRWVNYISDHLPQIEKFIQGVVDKAKVLWTVADKVADKLGGWKTIIGLIIGLKLASKVNSWTKAITGGGGFLPALRLMTANPWVVSVVFSIIAVKTLGDYLHQKGLDKLIPGASRPGASGSAPGVKVIGGNVVVGRAKEGKGKDKAWVFFDPDTGKYELAFDDGTGKDYRYWDDLSEADAAKALGISVAQLRATVSRQIQAAGAAGIQIKNMPPGVKRKAQAGVASGGGKAGSLRGYGGAGSVGAPPSVINYAGRHRQDSRGGHGVTPKEGFDCSGYLVAAYRAAGIMIPHNTVQMYNLADGQPVPGGYTVHVDPSNVLPGDAVLWDNGLGGAQPGHVGIYAGGGYCWAYSEGSGQPSKTVSMGYLKIMGIRRWVKLRSQVSSGGAGVGGAGTAGAHRTGEPGFGGGGGGGGGRGAPGKVVGVGPFGKIGKGVGGAAAGGAPSPFGSIGGRIAADVSGATAAVGASLDRMRQMIAARAAAIRAAIQKARADVVSSFGQFSSNVMSAFDAINSAWKSPASQALAKMQAEDAMKSAVDAYAQAVKEFGADSPEAQAAARALEEAKLEAQAKAEEEAHDAKVKADKDALEKQLAALEKEAAGAKTKAAAARIRKKINDLLASYGITPDTVAAATDWQTAQTLFVSSLGNLISSIDALTNAINGQGAKASGPPTSAGQGDRGTDSGAPGSPPGGRGGHPPPEFASGGAVPIMAHAGEYILRSSATRKIGVGNLNYMNRTGLLPSFQTGGLLDPTDSSGNPISMTSAVGSGVPYEIWRRKVAMAKYAKKEARISASRALWNPSRLPTPSSAADTLIDMWMEALGSDALFTERLGALKAFVDSGDAYRGGAVSRSWLTYGVPKLANGGYITRGGIAEVHRGETVTPAGAVHGPLVGELHVHNEVDEAHLVSKIGRAVYMLGIPS